MIDHATGGPVKTVLYIEDNPVNLFLVQAVFAPRADVDLVTAADGQQGLELARRYRPRLILLDLHLPDMDGEEFLERLRADPSIADLAVVIVSAENPEEEHRDLSQFGIIGYVTKPLDLGPFEQLVYRHLGEPLAGLCQRRIENSGTMDGGKKGRPVRT